MRGQSYDKKHYSLYDLALAGPVVVTFLSPQDPKAPMVIGQLRKIREDNKDQNLQILAVVKAQDADLWRWCLANEEAWDYDSSVHVIPDEFGLAMQKFGVVSSRASFLVGKNVGILGSGEWGSKGWGDVLSQQKVKFPPCPPLGLAPKFKF